MRLDNYLVTTGLFDSRTKAKQAIERVEIYLNSELITKPSYEIKDEINTKIERICENSFVSLGGFKLNKALNDFRFNPSGLICADIGASTGGFTDCLINNGASKVYAIDLNDSLLHEKLKNNNKVVLIVKNARDLTKDDFCDKIDLIVADLSFISITQVVEVFSTLLDDGGKLILLIKPQFETGTKKRFKNGIVRDKKIRLDACNNVYDCAVNHSLIPLAFTTAPIVEGKNIEYLMLLEKNGKFKLKKEQIII
ncbi:MAG: TlyA family RNA methyltransferase [Clostridia bacterium]|nr:TlyA family RNA methyltransferase [Clostridia bacterium]